MAMASGRLGQAGTDRAAALGWGLALAAVLAVLLVLRLLALRANATDLFFDEAQYWSWSLEPAFGYYSKPPLIAWVIRLSTDSCGLSEFCIRVSSPVMHTATALVLFEIGRRLYDAATGFFSGLVYATLPGVSLSAGIVSTDVPLLLSWAVAMLGFVALIDRRSWWPALVLGLGLGIGLNAKYAMIYLLPCIAVYLAATPARRALARDPRLWAGIALGLAMIAPNLLWNAGNGFATFAHTADNAKWTGSLAHPLKALEFLAAQFAVFGPILFASLIVITVRAWREGLPPADRLLLSFALPVLALVTVQAFLSRAHANWAAVAYVSATVLVTATLLREARRWLGASLAVHALVLAALAFGTMRAGAVELPVVGDPFARTLGWKAIAERAEQHLASLRAAGRPVGAVITDDRSVTAELLYYMRRDAVPVLAWRDGGRPHDHYELTRPFTKGSPEPVLLVAMAKDPARITARFAHVEKVAQETVPAGYGTSRKIELYLLSGFQGP